MPRYEYACTACGDHLEVVQSFKDDPLTVCPACQGPLRKVFQPIGIAFKGSGFYRNDSRGGSASGDGSAKEASAPAKEASAPAKEASSSSSKEAGTAKGASAKGGSGQGGSGRDSGGSSPSSRAAAS